MVICKERKFVFICVPRTGSQTLQEWFVTELVPPAQQVRGKFHRHRLPRGVDDSWVVVATVRHPLDRLVSLFYRFRSHTIKSWIEKRKKRGRMGRKVTYDFPEFVQLVLQDQRRYFSERDRITTVCAFLRKTRRPVLRLLRYETLERDVQALPFVQQRVELNNRYASKRKPLREYYRNPELLALALEWARTDCEPYGYECSLEAVCALRGETTG